jgi:acyl-homoserine-lactone acylase
MCRAFPRAALPFAALLVAASSSVSPAQPPARSYADRVEIRRTAFGVPHVLADDLGALGFGLAWVQLEDHGLRVVVELVRARGELARVFGRDSIDSDFVRRQFHAHAVATYHRLAADTRDLLEGYAAGVNAYVTDHGKEFPAWVRPVFTGHDAAALWVDETTEAKVRRFRARQAARRVTADSLALLDQGSNAWAFAPSRTTSGRAILLRNPHLSWDAGYYEAHLTVPGVINFYGDFRVGHPLYFNGGFNDHLGWATTNNAPDLEEIYALDVDPERPDHYRFDGGTVPLERVPVSVEFRNGPGLATEIREFWRTPLGPVVDRADGKVYVVRSPAWEEFRRVEQFLRMMQARSLAEWRAAVAMRAHVESNLTYADRAGNVHYVWNATVPRLPTPSGGDTAAIPAARSADVWTAIVPFDSLPQVLNPRGGYVQNANDPFHYTNLDAVHDSTRFPDPFPRPALGLRSQLSLRLARQQRKMSLEDVVRLKHDYTMLLAERVREDLVREVRATQPAGAVADAVGVVERWDGTTAPASRGGVLFEAWFRRYVAADAENQGSSGQRWARAFAVPWRPAEPTTTPRGIGNPARAAAAFSAAVDEVLHDFGAVDVAWGDVHRVRVGDVDVPVGGCAGAYGCFRVLSYGVSSDSLWVANRGDGWVLAVEFGRDGPRAYSVLAYGQSSRPESPHHADQAAMFARGELKRVAFTEAEIGRDLLRRYRPGRTP